MLYDPLTLLTVLLHDWFALSSSVRPRLSWQVASLRACFCQQSVKTRRKMLNSVFYFLLRITYSLIFTCEKCFWQKQLFVVAVRRLLLPRSSQVFNVRAGCFIKLPLWYYFISLRRASSHILFFSFAALVFCLYCHTFQSHVYHFSFIVHREYSSAFTDSLWS